MENPFAWAIQTETVKTFSILHLLGKQDFVLQIFTGKNKVK
jgi:hypothetical protein